jgi:hypothetical protein
VSSQCRDHPALWLDRNASGKGFYGGDLHRSTGYDIRLIGFKTDQKTLWRHASSLSKANVATRFQLVESVCGDYFATWKVAATMEGSGHTESNPKINFGEAIVAMILSKFFRIGNKR